MLKFRSASILFIAAFILVGLLHYFLFVSWWWLLIPVVLYKACIIYGSAVIQSDFYTDAYCSSVTTSKEIAITFDDGPHPEFTPQILSVLAKHNVPAAFFVIGKNITGHEDLIRQMDSAGHIIGNHTFSHSFFIDLKSKAGFIFELDLTADAVYKIIGKQMKLFRPPYGVTTPHLAKAAKALNYAIIGWNIRSLDTTADNEKKIIERVTSQIKPGAVLLFHDTSLKTVHLLEQTLNFAAENGFKIVSVEELLHVKAYE